MRVRGRGGGEEKPQRPTSSRWINEGRKCARCKGNVWVKGYKSVGVSGCRVESQKGKA